MWLISHLWVAGLLAVPWSVAQEAEPVSQEPQPVEIQPAPQPPSAGQEQEPAEETPQAPAEPQRVIGQAGSPEEATAFNAMTAETDEDLKISKATVFLRTFPDSGLTPLVHSELAKMYHRRAEVDNFLKHGEEALKEIPNLADLLGTMSFYYAETGQPFKAAESATKALAILGTLEKPEQLTPSEWATHKFFLSGESHYALGRVQLGRAQSSNSNGPEDLALQEAVKHFKQTLEANPTQDYASFRLAEAYERRGDIEDVLRMYAWTVAIGGNIAGHAQQRLDQLYKERQELTPMEEVLAEQKQAIEKAQQERQQLLDQIEAESRPAESTPTESTPVKITLPSTSPPSQPPQDELGGKSGATPRS